MRISHATHVGIRMRELAASAMVLAVGAGTISQTPMMSVLEELCTTRPMFSSAPAPAGVSMSRPSTDVRPLSCESLPNVPGKAVSTVLVHFPPLAYSGAHRHPGAVTAFVVKGSVRSQMAGSPAANFAAGSTWFEAPRALHLFAENESPTEPAELLVTFVADENCGPLVIPEPA